MATDIHSRLKQARIDAGYDTASDAARAFGWTVSSYLGYENGDRQPGKDTARKIAEAYRISLDWLLTGRGTAGRKSTLTIMGRIGAGAEIDAGVEQVPEEGLYDIEATIPLPDGAIGFEVVGESMWPRYDPGDVIVCLRDGVPLQELLDGDEAAVRLDDGRRFLKRVLKTPQRGVFNLESHNAAPIRGVVLDWAADVLATIRASKWRRITDADRRRLARKVVARQP